MKFRLPYDEDANELCGRAACQANDDEPLTQQQFAVEADLNEIIRRMGGLESEVLPQALSPDHFGDFSDVPDLRTALERVADAQARFRALPASVRGRFGNDPAALWAWVQDPRNREEAADIGLLARRVVVAPPVPPTVPSVPPPP